MTRCDRHDFSSNARTKNSPRGRFNFFGGEAPASQPLPWTLPWKLQPRPLPDDARIFQRLSVTQFRSYLSCPFRFYLQHGLGMNEIDPEKSEMDARDFGNLVHDALERFARDPRSSRVERCQRDPQLA